MLDQNYYETLTTELRDAGTTKNSKRDKPLSILQHPRGQDPHDQKLEMPEQIYNNKDIYVLRIHFTDMSTHIIKR